MALPTDTTPVAKALHTLKVLQQVAQIFIDQNGLGPDDALSLAWVSLGFASRPDPHGLKAKALAALLKASPE